MPKSVPLRMTTDRRAHRMLGAIGAALLLMITVCPAAFSQGLTLRVGHFPNVTHVQALIAHRCRGAATAGLSNASARR